MSYAYEPLVAAQAAESERAAFIRRTYAHLAGAILVFAGLLSAYFSFTDAETRTEFLIRFFSLPFSYLLLLGAFIAVGYLAQWWASSGASPGLQYMGLGLYILAQAVIFIPIMTIAADYANDPTLIPKAGIMTLALFAGLTVAVFSTRKDFSFLGPILSICSFLALGVIVAGMIFGGFGLGLWFAFAMVALASAFILYDTSNVLHHYRTDQHVAAALALFASVALLFFYILRIFLASRE